MDKQTRETLDCLAEIITAVRTARVYSRDREAWVGHLERASKVIFEAGALPGWKSMDEWKNHGPPNGTPMVVLLHTGGLRIAHFEGCSASWTCESVPVAWYGIPDIPGEINLRKSYIERERLRLANLEDAQLGTPFPGIVEQST